MARLSAHLVAHCRRQVRNRYSVRWLAKFHRVNRVHLIAAVEGRTWTDVPEPPVSTTTYQPM